MNNLKRAKVVFFAAACICCICLLSGCVKMTMGMKVEADGGGDVAIRLGFSEQASSMMSDENGLSGQLESMMETARSQGYTAEQYEEDGYRGIYITQHFTSLSQKVGTDAYTNGLSFTSSKGSGKRTFTLKGEPLMAGDVKAAVNQIASTTEGSQILVEIHMPFEITQANATHLSADKKTAIWDLAQFDGEIDLRAVGWDRLFGFLPVWIAWIVLGALALVAVVLVIIGCIKVARKKRHIAQPPLSLNESQVQDPEEHGIDEE